MSIRTRVARATIALVFAVLPVTAFADGGHPESGLPHFLAHLLYFGAPVLIVGVGLFVLKRKLR